MSPLRGQLVREHTGRPRTWSRLNRVIGPVVSITALVASAELAVGHSYVLFHTLVELFAVVIATGAFMVAWNARDLLSDDYLLFLGIGYLAVAGLGLAHILSYKGMGILGVDEANRATQVWIAQRWLQAGVLLAAPVFLRRRARPYLALAGFAAAFGASLAAIFWLDVFPDCFVEGVGLTPFKKVSEYIVLALLVAAAAWLYRERRRFDAPVLRLILGSIGLSAAAGFAFTLYAEPYGVWNRIGHVLNTIGFYLLYRATIASALRRPYSTLFRDLRASQQALARSNRELEAYAHTVSHDLRTPLAAIATSSEVLLRVLDRPPSPETRDRIERLAHAIGSSAQTAVGLADDMLALAEAGQRPTEVVEVDVAGVMTRVLDERTPGIQERGVRVELGPGLGTIRASPTHVYQLFSNLIGNAISHNAAAEPRVRIERLASDDGDRFRVSDNGPGIPPQMMDRLFLPFAKGAGGGHGLGLYTVQRIVEVYGGWVRAYNDGGACFELELRGAHPAEPAQAATPAWAASLDSDAVDKNIKLS